MPKDRKPTAGCRPASGPETHAEGRDYRSNSSECKEFFLHVGPSGREWRLAFEPVDVRSLRVTIADGVETTRTKSIKHDGGIIEPRPRGADWVKVDDSSDMFTEWARPARADEPLLSRQNWKNLGVWLAARKEGDE